MLAAGAVFLAAGDFRALAGVRETIFSIVAGSRGWHKKRNPGYTLRPPK